MYNEPNISKNLNLQFIDFKFTEINQLLSREIYHLKSYEALHLRVFIQQILKELPELAKQSIVNQRFIDKKRSIIKFDSNIEEIKKYLTMLENFGFAKTKHIRDKIDDLNSIVKFYAG